MRSLLLLLAAGCLLGFTAPASIATPEALAVEMAKALVSGDRARFDALSASKQEILDMLKAAQNPAGDDLKDLEAQVDETVAQRAVDFDAFQDLKKKAGIEAGDTLRFELVDLDKLHVKDGMKKIRHSRVRVVQTRDGKEIPFLLCLDDMFLFKRGWAFTSVFITPNLEREPPKKP